MKYVFASDIDNTLTGGPHEPLIKLSEKLTELQEQNKLYLILSTGRHLDEVIEGFSEEHLPYPKAVISQVGTEIYLSPFKKSQPPFKDWEELLKKDYKWTEAKKFVSDIEGVEMQPEIYNTDLKLSVYLHNAKNPEKSVKEIKSNIKKAKKADVYRVIWSSGKHLDIIPRRAGKGNAIKFLIKHLKLKPNDVIVAGDSGNDIDMFKKFEKAIAVANAQPELKAVTEEKDTYYVAKKEYSEGVTEGLKHFGIL